MILAAERQSGMWGWAIGKLETNKYRSACPAEERVDCKRGWLEIKCETHIMSEISTQCWSEDRCLVCAKYSVSNGAMSAARSE